MPWWLRGAFVVVAVAFGSLFAFGCVLAAYFEAQGFGSGRDSGPRTWYIVAMAAGFVACLGVPFLMWRLLLPRNAPPVAAAAVAAVGGVVLILGISLR